jgi:hypothetical protein
LRYHHAIVIQKTKPTDAPLAGEGTPVLLRLPDADLVALDRLIERQSEPSLTRSELARRLLVDRLVHEGLLPPSRAFSGHRRSEGLRPQDLNSQNDD